MARKSKDNMSPRIENRRALHDYFIESKLECGIELVGSEVKSLRDGKAVLQDAWANIEGGQLILHDAHIDPYTKAAIVYNHQPKRDRRLLAHRREIKRLANETAEKSTTLIPLAIYWVGGRAKVEIGVAKGKKQHDKRRSIKEREIKQEVRRATMTHRQ